MHTDDSHQAEADRRFYYELANDDAEAIKTVSIGEPEAGPDGITICAVRSMPDGSRRRHLFMLDYRDKDILGDPQKLRENLINVALADYRVTRREKIFRHFGVEWQ